VEFLNIFGAYAFSTDGVIKSELKEREKQKKEKDRENKREQARKRETCIHIHTCICIHIHIYIYTYIYIHIYIYMSHLMRCASFSSLYHFGTSCAFLHRTATHFCTRM